MTYPIQPVAVDITGALTSSLLRGTMGNLAQLFSMRPLLAAGQVSAAQSILNETETAVNLDTEYVDNWNGHVIGTAKYITQFTGWYLCEGNATVTATAATVNYTAGISSQSNGVPAELFGQRLFGNGTDTNNPAATDLVFLGTDSGTDYAQLLVYQASGSTSAIAQPGAYFKVEWVCRGGGGPIVITTPQAAALWPPGEGTQVTNSGGIAAGATTMTVASTTGIVVGSTLGLEYYQGKAMQPYAETTLVQAINGSTLTVFPATSFGHAQNAPVALPVGEAWMGLQVSEIIDFLAYPPVARLTNSGTTQTLTSQTVPSGTAITMEVATIDNFSGWNGTSEYVFPVSGVYYIYGQVAFAAAAGNISAGIAISGGTTQWGDGIRLQSSGTGTVTVRKHVRVTAGQYVQLIGQQGSGGTLALSTTASTYSTLIVIWRGF